ncbi:MAG: type II toxin-antitoxin system VapC family toxin [Candidatus Rokubacteria bacterium]|nr:type II toxin-antitoxin system VapC family toxin [Candidatus Rokubacteria bacterium]
MRYLFDTDHAVALLRNHPTVRSRVEGLSDDAELYTSVITAAELFYGAYGAKDSVHRVEEVRRFLADVEVLGLDLEGSEIYGRLKARLRAQGQLIADNDLYIASIALRHELVLLTGNTRHYERLPGLRLESWLTSGAR